MSGLFEFVQTATRWLAPERARLSSGRRPAGP